MFKEIDMRGMAYPLAINHVKQAMEDLEKGKLTAIVDNEIIKDGISRYAKNMDLKVNVEKSYGSYYIDIFKEHRIEEITSIETQYQSNKK